MGRSKEIEVLIADYLDTQHGQDPMGGETALSDFVIQNLAAELAKVAHAFSVICYVDGQPAGLINCFEAFSSFSCKPLINIHDILVVKAYRGLNISQLMLAKVEEIAKHKGCCKMTLEVLQGNEVAQKSYMKFGFDAYELDPEMGKALFWQKVI